jgi:sarcosine oxidase gamma subunit
VSATFAFLSLDAAQAEDGFAPVPRSPLAQGIGHAPAGVVDLSLALGKLEVYRAGASLAVAGAEVVPIAPGRFLILCPYEQTAEIRTALVVRGLFVVDRTGTLGALQLEGEQALRRLTDLDLDRLPAVGPVAHVRTVVLRDGDRFRLFFPQECGDSLLEAVGDALAGVA